MQPKPLIPPPHLVGSFIPLGACSRPAHQVLSDMVITRCSHLELHQANAIIRSPIGDVERLLTEHSAEDGRLLGLNLREHSSWESRVNLYEAILADEECTRTDGNHQPVFLPPRDLLQYLEDGKAKHLDAADYAHRCPEILRAVLTVQNPEIRRTIEAFLALAAAYAKGRTWAKGLPEVDVYSTDPKPGAADYGESLRFFQLPKPVVTPKLGTEVQSDLLSELFDNTP